MTKIVHSEKWPLNKLSACISLIALASAASQSAIAENLVISHPWIMADEYTPNPDPIGDLPYAFDSTVITGADGRPLKVLYRPAINSSLAGMSGATVILRTNIFSLTGDTAFAVTDDSLDGIVIDDVTVWSFQDLSGLQDPSKAAIHIGPSAGQGPSLTRGIYSSGHVRGGIYITGEAYPTTGSVYNSVGVGTASRKSTLKGGFSVINGGVAESISDHAVKLDNHAYIDYITSGVNSRITAKGENSSAVYVGEGGQLGGLYNFTHQVETLQTVADIDYTTTTTKTAINTDGEIAVTVSVAQTETDETSSTTVVGGVVVLTTEVVSVLNTDPTTGFLKIGDSDDIDAPDNESNYVKADINNDEIVDDYDDDGKKDLYKVVKTSLPSTSISPAISRSVTDTVIAVEGQLVSDQSTAIKIDGTATGKIHITPTGLLSGGLDNVNGSDVPEKSVLWVRKSSTSTSSHTGTVFNETTGSYTGTVFNEGTVNGGIFIHGNHTAPGNHSLYHGLGTSTAPAQLQGGYTVTYGGQATANDRAIHIGRHSTIAHVRVVGQDINAGTRSLLSSTTSNAVYIEEDGILGSPTAPTTPVVLVSDGAELKGNTGIVVRGNVYGSIHIDDGLLTAATNQNAVDYSNADSALLFKQTGSNAITTGSIVASMSRTDDKVEILAGTLIGNTLSGIDELVISTGANINLSGNFSVPTKTTLQIEEGFAAAGPVISVGGALTVGDTQLTIKPGSLAAYQELVASPTTIVVADAGSVSGNTDNVSTVVEGIALNYISATGSLLKTTGTTLNTTTNQLAVSVAAVDPSSFTESLINQSLTETQTTLTNMAVSAVASVQTADSEKAKALFQSLNSTTDFETLATQLAQPVEVTARSGIGTINTTQNITLSEARGQISGFSYGDGFDWGEVWGQAIYSESNQAVVSGKAGFEGKTNGYIIGAGLNLNNSWLVGLSGAMTTTATSGDQNKDLKTTSYISSLYSNWDNGGWFFDSLLTLGLSKNDTHKYIGTQKVEANYDSWLWGAKLIAGKHYTMGYWSVAPQLELNYGHVRFDEYTERGNSGWESKIKASDYEVIELGGGFRANSLSWLARGSIRPELSIMGYYDLKNQGSQFESTYLAGGDPFVVTEAERDRFRVQSSLGVSVDLLERLTINAAYSHNWSNHYKAHSFSAKANYKF